MDTAPEENGKKVLTMAEYVTKEQVIDWYRPYGQTDEPIPFEILVSDLKDMDAADVAPVRHGRWVNEQMIVGGFAETWACDCSVCGRTQREPLWKPNYCPSCGCKMDLEEEHHELRRDL